MHDLFSRRSLELLLLSALKIVIVNRRPFSRIHLSRECSYLILNNTIISSIKCCREMMQWILYYVLFSHLQCCCFGFAKFSRPVVTQNIPLDVLFEDEDVLAIHKPAGMVVQYAAGSAENAAAFYLNRTSHKHRFGTASWPWKSECSFEGIVHRIDKDTSGILLVAKHPRAANALRAAFEERRVYKAYLAIAEGFPSNETKQKKGETGKPKLKIKPTMHEDEPPPTPQQKRLSKAIKNCGTNTTAALELLYRHRQADQGANASGVDEDDEGLPSASAFSAAMSVCKRAGKRHLALSILDEMIINNGTKPTTTRGVVPNLLSFQTATSLCALDPPLWEKAVELVSQTMPSCGLSPAHPHCVSAAISACGRAGRLESALQLLNLHADYQSHPSCRAAGVKACERCGAHNASGDGVWEAAVVRQCKSLASSSQTRHVTGNHNCADHTSSDVSGAAIGKPIRVDAPIGKVSPRLMGVLPVNNNEDSGGGEDGGREASSIVTPLAHNSTAGMSLHRVVIETGRTHQIRVHMAEMLGCPLVGDSLYGGKKTTAAGRTMLHAAELVVPHPTTGSELSLRCPPPSDFENLVNDHFFLSKGDTTNLVDFGKPKGNLS